MSGCTDEPEDLQTGGLNEPFQVGRITANQEQHRARACSNFASNSERMLSACLMFFEIITSFLRRGHQHHLARYGSVVRVCCSRAEHSRFN